MEEKILDLFKGVSSASRVETLPPSMCNASRLTPYQLADDVIGTAAAARPAVPPDWILRIKPNNYARVTESQLIVDELAARESVRLMSFCDSILMVMKKALKTEIEYNFHH